MHDRRVLERARGLRECELRRARGASRSGFTLLEVIVALALGGLVLLGARTMLTQLADAADRLVAAAAAADRDANAERLLRALAARLEVGTDPSARFGGTETVARFTTWCDTPAGWLERCRAAILIDSLRVPDGSSTPALVAVLSTGAVIPLRRGFRVGALRYLNTAAEGGTWFHVWGEGVTAPLALGIILDSDTIIVRIGERG